MRRAQLQRHLLLRAKFQLLHVASPAQVPHVQLVSVLPCEQELSVDAILHHARCAPGAGDHGVQPEVPPDVICQLLRSAVDFPPTSNVKRFRIQNERAAGTIAIGRTQRTQEDAVRSAVHRVRCGVARPLSKRLGFDHLHDLRLARIRFCVEDVDPR